MEVSNDHLNHQIRHNKIMSLFFKDTTFILLDYYLHLRRYFKIYAETIREVQL